MLEITPSLVLVEVGVWYASLLFVAALGPLPGAMDRDLKLSLGITMNDSTTVLFID